MYIHVSSRLPCQTRPGLSRATYFPSPACSRPRGADPHCARVLGTSSRQRALQLGALRRGESIQGYLKPRRGWSKVIYQVHKASVRSFLGDSLPLMALRMRTGCQPPMRSRDPTSTRRLRRHWVPKHTAVRPGHSAKEEPRQQKNSRNMIGIYLPGYF